MATEKQSVEQLKADIAKLQEKFRQDKVDLENKVSAAKREVQVELNAARSLWEASAVRSRNLLVGVAGLIGGAIGFVIGFLF